MPVTVAESADTHNVAAEPEPVSAVTDPDPVSSKPPHDPVHHCEQVLYVTQAEKEKYLDELKTTIEALDVSHHVEILQKMQDFPGGVKINENRNGVYINLSYLPDSLVRELAKTVQYIKNQESILNIDEMSKDQFKRAYFAVQTT